MRRLLLSALVCVSLLLLLLLPGAGRGDVGADSPSQRHSSEHRERWTTSRVQGSPEAPPPYRIERVYADLTFDHPTEMVRLPGTDRWVVVQLGGPIVSFSQSPQRDQQVMLEGRQLASNSMRGYGITFHPRFPDQPWCYICYTAKSRDLAGTRLSRFRVERGDRFVIDPASELVLAAWNSEGHSGGSLHFGEDGYLYVSIGDGQNPNPPDKLDTGQNLTDLEASIIRIDVDHTDPGLPYAIPPDNPFVGVADVRPEIYAFGFRNPWKMAFDPRDGSLWTGDVGWEMMEMVYRVDRGANYGWSVMEGSQVVKLDGTRFPIPITPPMVEHSHVEARSVTGGYFWQSDRIPELVGAYIYGDWMTGKIWGLKHDGDTITWHEELADTPLQIICFALDDHGDVLVVGYDGTIHRLVTNRVESAPTEFPRRLSETGLFSSTARQQPAAGVVPYQINAHHWADGTVSQQWIGLPGDAQLEVHETDNWEVGQVPGHVAFPQDAVLAKTVSIQTDLNDPGSLRRLETQLLHRNGDDWGAYNYVWNEEQTDAVLLDNVSVDRELVIRDPNAPGGTRKQVWRHVSRDECLLCHIWRAGTVHGFKFEQLNLVPPDERENQLLRLVGLGLFRDPVPDVSPMISPSDEQASFEARARSYLHLNCAHCHRQGGGGTATFSVVLDQPLEKTLLINEPAAQGTFGIEHARIVPPGDPDRSVLLYRLLKSGRGHMPQFGANEIDVAGVKLIHDWIASIEPIKGQHQRPHKGTELINLGEDGPANVNAMLETTSGALAVAMALMEEKVSPLRRREIVETAARHPQAEIRDLFERFLPEDRRVKRLGNSIDEAALLALAGDLERGRQLFVEAKDVSCRQCHAAQLGGKDVGPSLTEILPKRTKAEILASILRPSEKIEEKYQSWIAVTVDGVTVTGLLTDESPASITLVDATGKEHRIERADLEFLRAAEKSLMPELLLADFTAQQAADLLAYLASLTPEKK